MNNAVNFKGFVDTTFRDGQQSPLLFDTYKYRFDINDKKELINGLIKLGVSHFEFFSPVVSEIEKTDFLELKNYARTLTDRKLYFLTHCRTNKDDIEKAIEVGFDGLNLYMGASKYAQKYSHKQSLKKILEIVADTIHYVRKKYPDIYLRFSAEDTFRTPLKDVYRIYDLIKDQVNTFGMPDTVGIATPVMVKERVLALKNRYPKVQLECHFHNDRSLSVINSLTAIEAGVEYVDTSIWGLAERSGITSLTALLLNLDYSYPDILKSYDLTLCYPLNVLMASMLKMQVPYSEPVSLTNRTHTAGVHQKAILNNNQVYEAHNLEKYGVSKNQVLLGPLSGWNLIHYYLKEVLGYEISKELAQEITTEFKKNAKKISRKLNPETLLTDIVQKYRLSKISIPNNMDIKRIENFN